MPRAKHATGIPLSKWFNNLPHSKLKKARLFICQVCGIEESVYYRWMSGRTPIPMSSQIILNQISGKKLYDVDDIISIESILKEEEEDA